MPICATTVITFKPYPPTTFKSVFDQSLNFRIVAILVDMLLRLVRNIQVIAILIDLRLVRNCVSVTNTKCPSGDDVASLVPLLDVQVFVCLLSLIDIPAEIVNALTLESCLLETSFGKLGRR